MDALSVNRGVPQVINDPIAEPEMGRLVGLVMSLFDMPMAVVNLVVEGRQWIKAGVGIEIENRSEMGSLCAAVYECAGVLVVSDAAEDPRFSHDPVVKGADGSPGVRFYAGAPLISHDGVRLGVLCMMDSVPRPDLDAVARERFASIAELVVDALERRHQQRRLVWEAKRNATQAAALRLAARGAPLKDVLDTVLVGIEELHPGTIGSVMGYDESRKRLCVLSAPHLPEAYCKAIDGIEVGPDVGSCGSATFMKQRVVVSDIARHPFWVQYREVATVSRLAACWSQPIMNVAGDVLGTFAFYYREPRSPEPWELDALEGWADLTAVILTRHHLEVEGVREQERQLMLIREVDHRAKNALAVAQAVVSLTRADDPEAFVSIVEGRIAALARAHELLALSRWRGVRLADLVERELSPFQDRSQASIHLQGPEVTIGAGAVQPLAMVFHELATNAAKYGSLSVSGGDLMISWSEAEGGGLVVDWVERGGPQVVAPSRSGFGSRMIKMTASGQLGGSVKFDWQQEGLACRITLSADRIKAKGDKKFQLTAGRQAEVQDVRLAPERPDLRGYRVLVVEDDSVLASALQQQLEGYGCIVLGPALDLERALGIVDIATGIDAAILDVDLSGRTSLPVAERLAAKRVPFLFATGYGETAFEHEAPVLRKPYPPEELLWVLGGLIKGA